MAILLYIVLWISVYLILYYMEPWSRLFSAARMLMTWVMAVPAIIAAGIVNAVMEFLFTLVVDTKQCLVNFHKAWFDSLRALLKKNN
jgi:hypothetical protein